MAIQMTGMASGLDTESMIQDLVKASSSKKTKLEGEQTKVEWKQKIWDDLNNEVYSFYSKTVESLKWESAYNAKKTTVDDASIATVISAENAVNGTQTLAVKGLAATGYLTGAKLGGDVKLTSTLGDLGIFGADEKGTITINDTTIDLSASTTISSLVTQMKNAGVMANFDEANQRFFISAKESGKDNDFTLVADDVTGLKALSKLGLLSADDVKSSSYSDLAKLAGTEYENTYKEDAQKLADKAFAKNKELRDANADLQTELDDAQSQLDSIKATFGQDSATNAEMAEYALANIDTEQEKLEEMTANGDSDDDIAAQAELVSKLKSVAGLVRLVDNHTTAISENEEAITKNKQYYVEDTDESGNPLGTVKATAYATTEAKKALDDKISAAKSALDAANKSIADGMSGTRIIGKNATIMLNGAEFESNTNTFSINGLTITAKGLSEKNADGTYKTTSLTTATDVDAIYDKIVKMFDEYNKLVTSFDKKYTADSARKYDMLTKEQKEDMTDDEVKAWEDKIKDSLLKRDDNLSRLMDSFESAMNKGYTIDGKKYSLSSFGIETLSYFDAAEHEKGNYHIDGYSEDKETSEKTDKLKKAIAENPEVVTKFFSQLMSDFYKDLNEQAKSTDYRTRNKFYDDKLLKTNYDDYKTKIKDQESYLDTIESRYRKQFTAMEKALTTTNSQTSYLSGLISNG